MLNRKMRLYDYYQYSAPNAYGQQTLDKTAPSGFVKMAITLTTQSVQDNIKYSDAQYIGFTLDGAINETFVIDYEGQLLKVIYVNKEGRYRQVYLGEI